MSVKLLVSHCCKLCPEPERLLLAGVLCALETSGSHSEAQQAPQASKEQAETSPRQRAGAGAHDTLRMLEDYHRKS